VNVTPELAPTAAQALTVILTRRTLASYWSPHKPASQTMQSAHRTLAHITHCPRCALQVSKFAAVAKAVAAQ